MSSSTESAADAAAILEALAQVDVQSIHAVLDLGSGDGSFLLQLVRDSRWPTHASHVLIEPGKAAREHGVVRIGSQVAVVRGELSLEALGQLRVQLFLANHCLYYVHDIQSTVGKLISALDAGGIGFVSMAGSRNALVQLWQHGFGLLGREVPYFVAEDLEDVLRVQSVKYTEIAVEYQIAFEDSLVNRLRIVRFLFAREVHERHWQVLANLLNPYLRDGNIVVDTSHKLYIVGPQ